jgi:hypothetical protein
MELTLESLKQVLDVPWEITQGHLGPYATCDGLMVYHQDHWRWSLSEVYGSGETLEDAFEDLRSQITFDALDHAIQELDDLVQSQWAFSEGEIDTGRIHNMATALRLAHKHGILRS